MWLSSLFMWVDVYGVPAKKPCLIKTHSSKREKRRKTSYASVLIYYFLVVFGENLLLSAYFYILRKELVYSQQNSKFLWFSKLFFFRFDISRSFVDFCDFVDFKSFRICSWLFLLFLHLQNWHGKLQIKSGLRKKKRVFIVDFSRRLLKERCRK